MASLSGLYAELSRYRNLRSSVEREISSLKNVIDDLEPAASKIGQFYVLDTVSADLNKTISTRNGIINEKNHLSSNVIPEIDREISRIQHEIEELEREDDDDDNDD